MKKILLAFIGAVLMLSSCTKDTVMETYTFYRPVYHTKAEVKADIRSSTAKSIGTPGKLFVKGKYVFLNELNKGVHIIDYSNPAAPQNIGFVNIPGNVDLAVRGNYLYADCYTDLVAIDITDPKQVQLKSFIEGVFPQRYYDSYFTADSDKVITDWVRVDTVVKSRYKSFNKDLVFMDMNVLSSGSFNNQSHPGNAANGTGGSLARFALHDNRMYAVSSSDLKVFNTTNAAIPAYIGTVNFQQGGIETIFPYENKLFIGSQTGMFIYGLANPDVPKKLGEVTHIRSCDPVIADGNRAYVTLKGGSICGGYTDQLDVLDISNILSPALIKTYPLSGPTGLSKDGNTLMICDGNEGLKFMNAADPLAITQVAVIAGIFPYDVIALNGLALTVAKDGLYFIDYSNPSVPVVLGKISISN